MTGADSGHPARLYLIGLMGSGKSTVGSRLAATLGYEYLDNDAIIATLAGRSTVELAELGGTVLHDWESRYVHHLATDQPTPFVAGVAASSADRPADLRVLRQTGLLVYLRSAPDVLARRIDRDQPRPWITGGAGELIQRMFTQRDPVLSEACALVVDATESPDRVHDRILSSLAEPSRGGA
jgi:shikimate kinase